MLPSKIDQMKASHETGSEANFGFGRALMPSYLEMLPPKTAFFSFRMQPETLVSWQTLAKRLMHMAHFSGNTSGVSKLSFDWLN